MFQANKVINPFVLDLAQNKKEQEVFIAFDNSVVIKTKNGVLRLDGIVYEDETIREGQVLDNCLIQDIE